MNKDQLLRNSAVAIVVSVVFLFFDKKISTGILLGFLFACLYWKMLADNIDQVIDGGRSTKAAQAGRMVVLAAPMLIACLFPEKFNVFGSFFGLMIPKLTLYILSFFRKG